MLVVVTNSSTPPFTQDLSKIMKDVLKNMVLIPWGHGDKKIVPL